MCETIQRTIINPTWWRHQMETFSAGNLLVTGEFPSQRPVARSFDIFLDVHLHKRLRKQSRRWWFETPSCSLWRHRNGHRKYFSHNLDFSINFETYCQYIKVKYALACNVIQLERVARLSDHVLRLNVNPKRQANGFRPPVNAHQLTGMITCFSCILLFLISPNAVLLSNSAQGTRHPGTGCIVIPYLSYHYNDVIMVAMASQIISIAFIYPFLQA